MSLKNYKSAEEVEEVYRWDLEDALQGRTVDYYISELKRLSPEIIARKDTKFLSNDNLREAIKLEEEYAKNFHILYIYLSNRSNTNIVDPIYSKELYELTLLGKEHSIQYGSEYNIIAMHKEHVVARAHEPEFANLKRELLFTIDSLQYKLDDKIEEYLNSIQKGNTNLYEIFSVLRNSEVDYGDVIVGDEKVHITDGNYTQLLKNADETVRKTAYTNYVQAISKHRQSFSKLLIQTIRKKSVLKRTRGYKSLLSAVLYPDQIREELLETLYNGVENLTPLMQKYRSWNRAFFKKVFNKEKKAWDVELSLVDVKQFYSIEEGQNLLLEALRVLPDDYYDTFKNALLHERWVDYMNYPNKKQGAYSSTTPFVAKKYILMNYEGTLKSVLTLAHEFGHSMHSYYSDKYQDVHNAHYPIILAEIASIFNEIIVYNHLLEKHKDDLEFSFFLLDEFINEIRSVVVRQVEYSNFEYELYKAIEEDKPLTSFEDLDKLYYEVARRYDSEMTWEKWVTEYSGARNRSCVIPHYYQDFYVYKYSLGFMIGCAFYDDYRKNGVPALRNFIDNFLSKGDSDWPEEILKGAGIDIYSKQLSESVYTLLKNAIDKYIEIGKQLFSLSKEEEPTC